MLPCIQLIRLFLFISGIYFIVGFKSKIQVSKINNVNKIYRSSGTIVDINRSVRLRAAISINENTLNEEPANPGFHIKVAGKLLNLWGVYCAFCAFLVVTVIFPAYTMSALIADLIGNGRQRRVLDWWVRFWAKTSILMCLVKPKLIGKENLPAPNETVVYVPNHTSFLDILFFSGFVPRPFKYFSKAEIAKIPLIGHAMKLAMHVFLKRDDMQSTLDATSLCIQRLKDGNSMVLFAEGTRSKDGRLQNFKKGAFQIAKEAGVKVIPVSIGNLYKWMPNTALLPLAPMRQTYIKIHEALDPASMPLSQLKNLCLNAVNSGLPLSQQSTSIKPSVVLNATIPESVTDKSIDVANEIVITKEKTLLIDNSNE